jgi:hypothetical protein
MRTDPADDGGLFIGRRPGTAPVRYRVVPQPSLGVRRAVDKAFAAGLLGTMMLVSLAFWGPIPAVCVWIGAQIKDQSGSGGLAIAVTSIGLLLALLAGLALLVRLDQFWILVRRAAGNDQRKGTIGPVFAIAAVIGITLFVTWFLLFDGPGPEIFGRG